jgi:ribonuclease Y
MSPLSITLFALLLAVCSGVVFFFVGRSGRPPVPPESEGERLRVVAAAEAEAQALRKRSELDAREITRRVRDESDAHVRAQKTELQRQVAEVTARSQSLERREKGLETQEQQLARRQRDIEAREHAAETVARSAAALTTEARARLEKVAGMTAAEARRALEDGQREAARTAVAAEVRKLEDQARQDAEERSRMILGAAIQRYAGEYVTERTVATVTLPSDDMKGRIIGREGRNIRALEAATGIDLIIDDTPEAVVISCFNPVRREIARLALTRLIADGRIHPTRIEEMVKKAEDEIEQQCRDAAEQASFDLGLGKLHPELARLVGSLKFRSSAAQNLLQHSIEVGFLAGAMAAELGLPVKTARRAGLLHDVGKAVEQEVEGSHAIVGAQAARKCGEAPAVCHAIESHHGETAAESVLDHIVDAANVLSGQRPGARREMLESYVQRLAEVEKIAVSFEGVERAFAIQAGREVRVLVDNAKISDDQARMLSKDIARRVESNLSFPGQIKVAVIRETRATDYAK